MALPPEQRVKFFFYVIESPSPLDIYIRRSEGNLIKQAVELNSIPCVVRTAISNEAFEASIKVGLPEAMNEHKERVPIIHISAHGNGDGIQLSTSNMVNWNDLRELLKPVNQALGGGWLYACLAVRDIVV